MGDTIIQKIRQTDIDDIEKIAALIRDGEATLDLHKRAEEEQANDKDLVTNNFELYQARRRTIQIYKKLSELIISLAYVVFTSLKRCADDNLKKDAKHNELSRRLDDLEEKLGPTFKAQGRAKWVFGKNGMIAEFARIAGYGVALYGGYVIFIAP